MVEYKKCALSEIGSIVSGATPKTSVKEYYGGNIAWITPADLSGYTSKYISHGTRYLTEEGYNSCSTQLMPKGTVLFSSRAPIGYVAIADNPVCTNQGFKSIVPNECIDSEFLYYQLISMRKELQDMGSGTTFKELSAKRLAEVQLIVPLISEQKRIVARIEELLSQLDTCVETLNKTKVQLAVYRQAVLKEAFEEISIKVPFGSITESRLGKMLDKDKNVGIPRKYLRNINVRWFEFDLNDLLEMKIENNEVDKYSIKKNDLVICEGGEPGRCAVWKYEESIFYQKALHRVRFIDGSNPYFYMYYMWYAAQTGLLKQYFTGSGIKHLTGQSLELIPVPIADVSFQDSIVYSIESRLSVCNNIDQTVNIVLQQADAMRQSILKQAFEGRL